MNCPSCTGTNIYRSHGRNIVEKTLRIFLPIHYYRCHDCNWRGMRVHLKWNTLAEYTASILYIAFLAAIVFALVGAMLFLLVFRPV